MLNRLELYIKSNFFIKISNGYWDEDNNYHKSTKYWLNIANTISPYIHWVLNTDFVINLTDKTVRYGQRLSNDKDFLYEERSLNTKELDNIIRIIEKAINWYNKKLIEKPELKKDKSFIYFIKANKKLQNEKLKHMIFLSYLSKGKL